MISRIPKSIEECSFCRFEILYFAFIVCNFVCKTYSSNEEVLIFELLTVNRISLGNPEPVVWFTKPEDRQKLCFYAAIKAKIPWVDFSYVPYWQKNIPLTVNERHVHGMLCKGLPDFYLLRRMSPRAEIQIRIIRSPVDEFKFENSKIPLVKLIPLGDNLDEKFRDIHLAHMRLDDRKNLCLLAQKNIEDHLYFVNGDVGEAQQYEFEYAHEKITDIAIPCPTSPKLYLCRGDLPNRIKILLFKSGIDLFSFESDIFEATAVSRASTEEQSMIVFDSLTQLNADDRVNLCTLARQWNGLTTLDTDRNVSEAQMYKFEYSGKQKEQQNVAILCPAMPPLYLRLMDHHKIKLTFLQIHPNFHVSGVRVIECLYPKPENKRTQEDEEKLRHHLFTGLEDETRWGICHIAQKYLLQSKNRLNFKFTRAENSLLPFQLLLTPNSRSMNNPFIHVIRTGNQDEYFEDIVYRCTRWPEMYIRLGTSTDQLEIIFLKKELSNLYYQRR